MKHGVRFEDLEDGKHYIRQDWHNKEKKYIVKADTRYVDKNLPLLVHGDNYTIYVPSKIDYKKKWIEL